MKKISLILCVGLFSSSAFADDCTEVIYEWYNSKRNAVQKIELLFDSGHRAIYSIRANYYGGDFKDEAVMTSQGCKIVEISNVWSE